LDFKINSQIAIKWFKGKMEGVWNNCCKKKKKGWEWSWWQIAFQDETFPESRDFHFTYLESSLTLVIEFSFSN
jgi:hypothetical protein